MNQTNLIDKLLPWALRAFEENPQESLEVRLRRALEVTVYSDSLGARLGMLAGEREELALRVEEVERQLAAAKAEAQGRKEALAQYEQHLRVALGALPGEKTHEAARRLVEVLGGLKQVLSKVAAWDECVQSGERAPRSQFEPVVQECAAALKNNLLPTVEGLNAATELQLKQALAALRYRDVQVWVLRSFLSASETEPRSAESWRILLSGAVSDVRGEGPGELPPMGEAGLRLLGEPLKPSAEESFRRFTSPDGIQGLRAWWYNQAVEECVAFIRAHRLAPEDTEVATTKLAEALRASMLQPQQKRLPIERGFISVGASPLHISVSGHEDNLTEGGAKVLQAALNAVLRSLGLEGKVGLAKNLKGPFGFRLPARGELTFGAEVQVWPEAVDLAREPDITVVQEVEVRTLPQALPAAAMEELCAAMRRVLHEVHEEIGPPGPVDVLVEARIIPCNVSFTNEVLKLDEPGRLAAPNRTEEFAAAMARDVEPTWVIPADGGTPYLRHLSLKPLSPSLAARISSLPTPSMKDDLPSLVRVMRDMVRVEEGEGQARVLLNGGDAVLVSTTPEIARDHARTAQFVLSYVAQWLRPTLASGARVSGFTAAADGAYEAFCAALRADAEAVQKILEVRVPCKPELAALPMFSAQPLGSSPSVSLLGLLNALFHAFTGGYFVPRYDNGKLVAFSLLSMEEDPEELRRRAADEKAANNPAVKRAREMGLTELREALLAGSSQEVEALVDARLRHQQPSAPPHAYLMHWLRVARCFFFAPPDDSWGEFEKLFTRLIRNCAENRRARQALRVTEDETLSQAAQRLSEEVQRIHEALQQGGVPESTSPQSWLRVSWALNELRKAREEVSTLKKKLTVPETEE